MASYIGPPQSGSLRSDTFSRNRYGQYLRNRSIPVNPQTAAQTTIRTRMTTLSQGWRNLSDAQRAAWSSYADTHPVVTSLGEFKYLSGNAMFVKIGQQRFAAGLANPVTPPGEPAFVSTALTLVATAGTPALTVAGTDQPADYKAVIRCTPPLSAGVSYPPRLKQIAAVDANAWSTPVSILTPYVAAFGALVAGQKIIVHAQLASDEGTYGPLKAASVIVAA